MKKTMKKALAATLAATMVVSMSVPAFADETPANKGNDTVTVSKVYQLGDASATTNVTSPAEVFTFSALEYVSMKDASVDVTEAWLKKNVPTIDTVTFNAGEATVDGTTKTATITLPTDYPGVGVFTYKFTEVSNDYAGVTYHDNAIYLVVTVKEENGKYRVAAVHTEEVENDAPTLGEYGKAPKSDSFTNTYDAGSLSVKKEVTGNMGDQSKEFEVKVTFTAPADKTVMSDITYIVDNEEQTISADTDTETEGIEGWTGTKEVTLNLKHDETVTFNNIPFGVKYTVVESDYTTEDKGGYDAPVYTVNDEVAKEKDDAGVEVNADEANDDINEASESVLITNNKGVEVDTGISLDNMPYLMMLALSFLGFFGFVSKKRKMEF